jgi:hypothetical protein
MYDEEKEEPITTPDTENATHFHYEEAPDHKQDKFRKFHLYNTGLCNGKWTNQQLRRKMDNLARFDAISSQLELTEYQKRRGRKLFKNINLSKFGVDADIISFCLMAIVARSDNRIYHPQRNESRNDPLFQEFAEELHCSNERILSCYNKVEREVNV